MTKIILLLIHTILILPCFSFSQNTTIDTDNDGISDYLDECPFEFGTIKNNGCPDLVRLNKLNRKELQDWEIFIQESIGKYGCLDLLYNVVIPFKYDRVFGFKKGIAQASLNGKWGFIDKENNTVIEFKFDNLEDLYYDSDDSRFIGLYKATLNSKQGIFSLIEKKFIVSPIYDDIRKSKSFDDGYIVRTDGKFGLISSSGVLIIPCIYISLSRINSDLFTAEKNGYWGVINNENKVLIPFIYENLRSSLDKYNATFNEISLIAIKNGKSGLINAYNNVIIPFDYDYLNYDLESKNKYLTAQKDDNYGVINLKNQILIPFQFDALEFLNHKYLVARDNGFSFENENKNITIKIIDINGNNINKSRILQIAFTEDAPWPGVRFDDITKCFVYNSQGKKFVIDTLGNFAINPKYEFVSYKNKNFITKESGKYGVMDLKGNVVISHIYDDLAFLNDDYLSYKVGDKYGILNFRQRITDAKYDDIRFLYYLKQFRIRTNNKFGLIDTDGKERLKAQYYYLKDFKIDNKVLLFLGMADKIRVIDENLKCIKNCED